MQPLRIERRLWALPIWGVAAAVFLWGALSSSTQKKNGAVSVSSVLAQDKGKFNIELNGQTVGHEEFEISPSGGGWTAKGASEIKAPDAPATKVSGTLVLQPDGAPVSYEWTSQAEKKNGAHILFANGIAKITLEMEGARPFEQDLTFGTPLIAVLDNNLYYQYGVLARIYNWTKRGEQDFPVLIPQDMTPGSIKVEASPQESCGKAADCLRVTTSDLEVLLYLDGRHRLMRLEVPAAKVAVFRE